MEWRDDTIYDDDWDSQPATRQPHSVDTAPCPFCGKHVIGGADVCRFCGSFINFLDPSRPPLWAIFATITGLGGLMVWAIG